MSFFFLSLIILIYPGFIVKLEACGFFLSGQIAYHPAT
jgi:hypothetical protein